MATFLILTKTNWNEPKRIRHQVADLLIRNNHKVVFIEKGTPNIFKRKIQHINEQLIIYTPFKFLHHQLRFIPLLMSISKNIFSAEVLFFTKKLNIDYVINFNYDGSSILKKINRSNLTVIGDNFVAQSKPFSRKIINNEFVKTLQSSKSVLTVSVPLLEICKKYNLNSFLFLPWSGELIRDGFKSPKENKILYYGYITHKINWDRIIFLLDNNIKIDFYGPIVGHKTKKLIKKLLITYSTVKFFPPKDINQINVENYCCSIQPYSLEVKNNLFVSLSNRTLILLSRGIPSLHEALPFLIKAPKELIYKCETNEDYLNGYFFFRNNHAINSNVLKDFLHNHTPENRYQQIVSLLY